MVWGWGSSGSEVEVKVVESSNGWYFGVIVEEGNGDQDKHLRSSSSSVR